MIPEGVLYRYTNLGALFDILVHRRLTLLNYSLWDDHNDQYYLNHFKSALNLRSVLAVCFTMASEQYHHWRVFAPGSDGVRISFRREVLLSSMRADSNVMMGPVQYKMLKEMNQGSLSARDLPFLKRHPYRDEKEFRILWIDQNSDVEYKTFDLTLDAIERITLGPWLPPTLSDSLKKAIKKIDGCRSISVVASTLRDSARWKRKIQDIAF